MSKHLLQVLDSLTLEQVQTALAFIDANFDLYSEQEYVFDDGEETALKVRNDGNWTGELDTISTVLIAISAHKVAETQRDMFAEETDFGTVPNNAAEIDALRKKSLGQLSMFGGA